MRHRPSGTIRMPPGPWPTFSCLTTFLVATSTMISSSVPGSEIRTSLPSFVNFSRFECFVCTLMVWITLLVATSITETVPSPEFAAQTSLSSGEMSMPSGPLPTGMLVSFQPEGSELFSMAVTESGVDVGGEKFVEVFGADQHVGAVLADAQEPVNFIGGGIVAGDEFVEFGGEVGFAVGEEDAVRTAKRTEVYAVDFFLRD